MKHPQIENLPKAKAKKEIKIPRTAGRMRFTKCGSFRGFKHD